MPRDAGVTRAHGFDIVRCRNGEDLEQEYSWRRGRSTLKTYWRHCEAGSMDGLSNVHIEEIVAPAVRKVTSRIVKIDRQTQLIKH